MNNNLVLIDGAVGTSLWEKAKEKVPVWRYNVEDPAIVIELHKEYIEAGSKVILANTFGANGGVLSKAGYDVSKVVGAGVRLAKTACKGTDTKVAFSVGPLSELVIPRAELEDEDFDEEFFENMLHPNKAREIYDEMIDAGVLENPDYILIQTFMDIEMMCIAIESASRYNIPIWCCMSFEKSGKTMMGNSVEDMMKAISKYPKVSAVGLNCSLGPDLALPIIKQFREYTSLPLIFKPNAGQSSIKDGIESHEFDIESFVDDSIKALQYDVTYIGGCCGSNPKYITALNEKLKSL